MSDVIAWLLGDGRDVLVWAAVIVFAVAVLRGLMRARERQGEEAERLRHYEAAEKVRSRWDEVDSDRVDFDDAVERLRERSRDRDVS